MSDAIDITGRSALQIGALVQSGLVDAEQVAETVLAAVERERDAAIFTRVTAGRAMTEARDAARRIRAGRPTGPLDGVPVAWKDLFDLEGIVTTAGSTVLADDPPAVRDAAVVAALKAAGMVTVGRVNMTEFAFSGIGINPHHGTPANGAGGGGAPRIPGGSSSGSGVAVARGLVPVSIGTDTGGSVRIPAALNGIVGYKATRGRYPMDGVFPLASSLDSLGVLCRTVADAVAVDAAMRGLVASPVRRGAVEGRRLVVPENEVFEDCEPEVAAAFEAGLARLAAAGATIERRRLAAFSDVLALYRRHGPLVTAEAYAVHEARLSGPQAARMDPRVVARARLGANISMTDYVAILAARGRLMASFAADVGDGLVVHPTVPHVAPEIAPLLADDDLFFAMNARTLRNTLIGNYLDVCGVSLPCGTGAAGMPVGLLVTGLAGSDDDLLSFALAAEPLVRGEAATGAPA